VTRLRLVPEDDLIHPLEAAPTFNESRYGNLYDAATGLGGWYRVGLRPNEGHAEVTVCLYLPDGSVAFTYGRPAIDGHTAHAAGGLRIEVVEPFAEHRVTYDGRLTHLARPAEMEDPRAAFAANPRVEASLDLSVRAVAPPVGGEPVDDDGSPITEDPERAFARGHTDQHVVSSGTVQVGDAAFDVSDALGLRDHSWGPRTWQAIWWYRWLTINLGPDVGMVCTVASGPDGPDGPAPIATHGFVYDRGRYGDDRTVPIRSATLRSDYDDAAYHRAVHAVVTTDDHDYVVEGEVRSSIPLRNRRDGRVTRIVEGLTTWRCGDLVGSGLAEYLDQIVDGRPVGASRA
jgi:hypothetical protein